mgnify:CR=1 FL=1
MTRGMKQPARRALYRDLAGALRAGLSPPEAFDSLAQGRAGGAEGARRLRELSGEGAGVAEALEDLCGRAMPTWESAVIRSAERGVLTAASGSTGTTGSLAATLEALSGQLELERESARRLCAALAYGGLVILLIGGLGLALSRLILPPLIRAVRGAGLEAEAALTQARALAGALPWLGAAVFALFLLRRLLVGVRHRRGRGNLRVPLGGERYARSLALVSALRLQMRAEGDPVSAVLGTADAGLWPGQSAARRACRAAEAGRGIAEILAAARMLPPGLVERLARAERYGDPAAGLASVEEELSRLRREWLEALPGRVSVVVTLLVGGLLLWVALRVVVPALGAFGGIGL